MFETIDQGLQHAKNLFQQKGIDNPQLDAEVLLASILSYERADLYLNRQQKLSEAEQTLFQKYVERRCQHEPVAYITGYKEFWSIPIKVTPAVLIPRPETEMLVEKALEILQKIYPTPTLPLQRGGIRILDLCTGSGCIIAALAREWPEARFTATDLSSKALAVARENLGAYKDRVHFLQSDLFAQLGTEKFDLIVSNPPYLTSDLCKHLDLDIIKHEPMLAIDGGSDGKQISDRILQQAGEHLHPHGFLVMELGPEILVYSYKDLWNN